MICDETKNQVKGVGSVKTTKIDNTFHQMMTENILEGEDIKKITNGIAESEKNMDGQNNNKIFEIVIGFLVVMNEKLRDGPKRI